MHARVARAREAKSFKREGATVCTEALNTWLLVLPVSLYVISHHEHSQFDCFQIIPRLFVCFRSHVQGHAATYIPKTRVCKHC